MLKLSLKDIDNDISSKVSMFCDNTHLGEAYAEYCKKVKTNWENFVNIVTSIIDKSYDYLSTIDVLDNQTIFNNITDISQQAFGNTDHNIVSLSKSFLSINDFCLYLSYLIMIDEDLDINFPDFEWNNSIVEDTSLTLDDILFDINSIWHSVTVDSATAETLSLTEGLSISERLSAFRDVISRTFSSAFDDISGYLGRCQDMITNGLSAMEVWRENLKTNGIYDMAKGHITYPSQSENFQYQGVSPASAYYWDTVADKVSSTVVGLGTAIISGTNWLYNKGKKWTSNLFKKTVKIVQEKVVNPHDLEIINDQGNYTIDTTFSSNIMSIILDKSSVLYKDIVVNNKSICIETKFSEHIIQRVKHSSDVEYNTIPYFQNLLKSMRLWYMQEKGISQVTNSDFSDVPNNILDLSIGIINNGNDTYDLNLSIIENFQKSRFKLYINPISLMTIIRLNFIKDNFSKVTLLCKTKYKPINTTIFFTILKNMCELIDTVGLEESGIKSIKLKSEAYELISNSTDLYVSDVTNEVGMYNSILASYILDTIFWGDSIGDYSYYITYNRGLSDNTNLFNTSVVGYYLEQIYNIAQSATSFDQFCDLFDQHANLYYFVDTYDTEDSNIIGITTNKIDHDISFKTQQFSITNLDYFNLCSLTNRIQTFNYQSVIDNIEISGSINIQIPTIYELYISRYSGNRGIISMLQLYFSAFNQETVRPLDFKFIPYTTGRIDFKPSMFRIRTDAENIMEFNNFITGVVTGVIIIAATISSVFLIKSVVRKSMIIRNATKRKIENKILNKEKLTSQDIKRYAKYNRKQTKLSKIVGNSVQASNILSNDNILDANDKIISLITGEIS